MSNAQEIAKEIPHYTEYLRAFGPLVIGVFVAYIAWQQWRVNRANLREKLFDRRWQVFKESQAFLSIILRDAACTRESLADYTDTCQRSRFLFREDVSTYLFEVRERAIKMRLYQTQLEGLSVGEKRSTLVDQESDELKWLVDQLDVVFDKFLPYLSFKEAE